MAEQDTTPSEENENPEETEEEETSQDTNSFFIEGVAPTTINDLTLNLIENQEKLVEGQAHAGYQVWNASGIATARIKQNSADIVGAIKGIAPQIIAEEDKDDAEDDAEAEIERKRLAEAEEERKRKEGQGGMLAGIGGLLKSLAVGKDGKGEKSLFGKGGIWGIAKSMFGILWKLVKFIGGPLLLIGGLAYLAMDEGQQKEAIEKITKWFTGLWEYIKFLGGAFKDGFMSGMDDVTKIVDGKEVLVSEGLKTKFENMKKAWGKAFSSLDTIEFSWNGTKYTGLAGFVNVTGKIFADVVGVFVDFVTGIGNFIADPNKFIGEVEGKIMALFDALGALISDFWHEGIANPRTWRNLLMKLDSTGTLAATAGLSKGSVQAGEEKKRQQIEEETSRIPEKIKTLNDELADATKNYTGAQRRYMASEIVRMKAEEIRNKEKIANIEMLHKMDNREAEMKRLYAEVLKESGIDLETINAEKIAADKELKDFRRGKMKNALGSEIAAREQKFTTQKEGDVDGRLITVGRIQLEKYLEDAGVMTEEEIKTGSLAEMLKLLQEDLKDKVGAQADTIEGIFRGEGGTGLLGLGSDTGENRMKQLAQITTLATKREAEVTTQTTGADQKLTDAIKKLDTAASKELINLITKTAPKTQQGGLIDYTGLTMVHGGAAEGGPEVMFDNVQMNRLEALLTLGERDRGGGGSNDFSTQNMDNRRITSTVTNIAAPQKHLFGVQEQRFGIA